MTNAAQNIEKAPDLRVGRRIHCILYGGKNGTISAVEGTPGLGNSRRMMNGVVSVVRGPEAHITVVWDNGTISMQVPECICTGVQWRFLDEPDRTQAEINEAIAYAEKRTREAEEAREAARNAFAKRVEEYRNFEEFSHYEQSPTTGHFDRTKLAAKNIRKLLKKEFPGVKFSVRKESYGSIWISWSQEDDGQTVNQKAVHDAVAPFKTGVYHLHEDYHSSEESPFNIVFGGVDYITAQPSFS
ncbi:LPD29 domain-containing protein [Marinobacter sp.]|uniref:LPD29 domain-containing protein n=1 Tax=Marinobacter sp. TaxID=50741 RepID=UPI003568FECF